MLCQVLNPVLQNHICLRVVDFLIAGHFCYAWLLMVMECYL